MSEIDTAIAKLDAEIAALGFPAENTAEWWTLRAKSTGVSLLRAIQAKSLTTLEADQFRKGVRIAIMKSPTQDVIEVAKAAALAEAAALEATLPPIPVTVPK